MGEEVTFKFEGAIMFSGHLILYAGSFIESPLLNAVLSFAVYFACIFILYQPGLNAALFHSIFITIALLLSEVSLLAALTTWNFGGSDYLVRENADFKNVVLLNAISKLIYFLILQCTSSYIKQKITKEYFFGKSTLFVNTIPDNTLSFWVYFYFLQSASQCCKPYFFHLPHKYPTARSSHLPKGLSSPAI